MKVSGIPMQVNPVTLDDDSCPTIFKKVDAFPSHLRIQNTHFAPGS
jgi:hypothetical protein